MKRLVFHIGPGKCGSSTIQHNLAHQSANYSNFAYSILKPDLILKLSRAEPEKQYIKEFQSLLSSLFIKSQTVALSHELVFQNPVALGQMVKLAKGHSDDIRIIGYCRRPSDFIQSSFCQWIFRNPDRAQETWKHVEEYNISPDLFSGLERHFIAAIKTNLHSARQNSGRSIINWKDTYDHIERLVLAHNAELSVGAIPSMENDFSLMEDFSNRSGIVFDLSEKNMIARANLQFDLDIVEAVQIAIIQGLEMPNPHQENTYFFEATKKIPSSPVAVNPFLDRLKACVDGMLWEPNNALATRYGFDPISMFPRAKFTITETVDTIRQEHVKRRKNQTALLLERNRVIGRLAKLSYEQFRQS